MPETFPEHYQSADSTVSVLKRVDCLKPLMEINNIFESGIFFAVIFFQQSLDLFVDIFRLNCDIATDLIRQFLVIADSEP